MADHLLLIEQNSASHIFNQLPLDIWTIVARHLSEDPHDLLNFGRVNSGFQLVAFPALFQCVYRDRTVSLDREFFEERLRTMARNRRQQNWPRTLIMLCQSVAMPLLN